MKKLVFTKNHMKALERLVPKEITKKLNKLELDCELIDLIEIHEKVNGELRERKK